MFTVSGNTVLRKTAFKSAAVRLPALAQFSEFFNQIFFKILLRLVATTNNKKSIF